MRALAAANHAGGYVENDAEILAQGSQEDARPEDRYSACLLAVTGPNRTKGLKG